MVADYNADRRLFAVMKAAGWKAEKNGGFSKLVRHAGSIKHRLWVSWRQAEDALRLADAGEKVQGMRPVSEVAQNVVVGAANLP